MTKEEKEKLAAAAIPLEALCIQIRSKPYNEMTTELQQSLLQSVEIIRELLFEDRKIDLSRGKFDPDNPDQWICPRHHRNPNSISECLECAKSER
jgi:hypothetical protein